jgi:hypothetical protein
MLLKFLLNKVERLGRVEVTTNPATAKSRMGEVLTYE